VIVIHSEVPIHNDSKAKASKILKDMASTSREESGVIDYRVTFDIEAPTTARIIEQYEDWEAVESHESSSHLDWFQKAIEPHMCAEPTLYQYEVTKKSEAEGP
jgi:quinol monooxygenase YgiN